MSWRTIVISKRAKLDLQLGYMVVRSEEVTKIVLSEISTILIESTAVSLTTGLLAELSKRKIKVIFCDEKRNPSSELVSYYGSHDTSNKVRKQIAWKQKTKEAVWTEIVTEKIRKQKEILEILGKEESEILSSYIKEITWNDGTNREGHAAKVYFNALFGLDFTRTEDNYINDEQTGTAVDAVSAALILADKTDVRRNRVRNPIKENFDMHDRVNYAAVASSLQVNVEKKVILLEIELDEEICSILDYFEIFLQRMLMCKRAAEILGLKFKMKANGNKIC